MNDNARDDDHSDGHYTATGPTKHARAAYQPARTRLRRAAPSLDVVAAAEYLLTQPDAYLYRRRYLDLITQTPGPTEHRSPTTPQLNATYLSPLPRTAELIVRFVHCRHPAIFCEVVTAVFDARE
ncbi:hypothetical protein ACBG85_06190 [Rhodococcus sp. NyZ502]|uniref:hypothetical protein n=1 Tax=Rhodococcus sp. NyZ502 TaxID=3242855 RepID=UPI0035587B1C